MTNKELEEKVALLQSAFVIMMGAITNDVGGGAETVGDEVMPRFMELSEMDDFGDIIEPFADLLD